MSRLFELKVTVNDVIRTAWTAGAVFVGSFILFAAPAAQKLVDTCNAEAGCDWNGAKVAAGAAALAAVSAAITFVKNAVLKDGTRLKG